ncbi:hypothetical protein [Lacihabitans soyangensis]|uniref:Uncharacterized protein n=1 Tax=Lacihabitans soyangensis TaxID=869394 RepID=A0AAE3KUB5_9BACT|nr:hypothetical protein [Lacihabitans soyangensis]MCP9765397.1 hypothetical protein [Lacihabitans soyangensis]
MYKTLIVFLVLGVFRCDRTEVIAEKGLAVEWRYVGTFSHLVDYKCFICDGYDFEKSKYVINFLDANNYTANINLLRGKGEYSVSFEDTGNETISGTFENLNLQILNKPYENQEDSKFQAMFSESTNFTLVQKSNNEIYDQLTLGSNNSEYLLFVRK